MPLQQISLDQSIYNKPKWGANAPKAPQRKFLGTQDTSNRFVQEQEAKWAAEDKEMKEQRKQQMLKLQNIGAQTVQKAQQATMAQAKQQQEIKQQVESNPEPAAKEMYELMKTLPDDAKTQLLQQIFTPKSTGGFIEAGGVRKDMPDKYNPIANVFLEKGWAMFDPKGNVNLSEPVREFEKGTYAYNADDDVIVNTATGDIVKSKVSREVVGGIDPKTIADAYNYGSTYMGRLTEPTMLEKIRPENMAAFMDNARKESQLATMNYLLGQGVGKKEANDIAYSVPFEERGTTEPIKKTGRVAPLDEEKAKGLANFLKDNPNANIEAYRDRDGDATVDKALEILGKKPETTTAVTTATKPIKKEEVKAEPKVKDYFKGFPNLPYYP